MSTDYYDRDGKPISVRRWAELFENFSYRKVANTIIEDWRISTIWLGLDHAFGPNTAPEIFETMIFGPAELDYKVRYTTLEQALDGHEHAIAELPRLLAEARARGLGESRTGPAVRLHHAQRQRVQPAVASPGKAPAHQQGIPARLLGGEPRPPVRAAEGQLPQEEIQDDGRG